MKETEQLIRDIKAIEDSYGRDVLTRASFLQEQEKRHAFYYGLSVQYARTNHVKGARLNMKEQAYKLYSRIANVLARIMAINVGHNLAADHDRHRVLIVENATAKCAECNEVSCRFWRRSTDRYSPRHAQSPG